MQDIYVWLCYKWVEIFSYFDALFLLSDNMKFLFYLLAFFLLLDRLGSSESLIRDCCKKAAKNDPNLRYTFCVASLEESPRSKNASLQGLVVISTQRAVSYATRTQRTISKILKDKKRHNSCEIPLHDCLELYSDAKYSLAEALGDISSRDYEAANIDLSSQGINKLWALQVFRC